MPLLIVGAERCSLHPGTHTIGGRGVDALDIPAIDWRPPVASITVPAPGMGPCTIQRITAAIVVRVDGDLLGVRPAELRNGAVIEFEGCRLMYEADVTGSALVHSEEGSSPERPRGTRLVSGIGARVVNMHTGQAFALTDRRVVLGRDDSCDLVLRGKGVSRRHASISPAANGYLLRDESVNGTMVNGRPLSGTHLLAHGDRIRLHDEELRFDVEGMTEDHVTATDNDATQVIDLSHIGNPSRGGGATRRITCRIEIVKGPLNGTTFDLDKPVGTIGRARHNDVQVRDDSVSSAHATLLRKGDAWYIVDLRSANGTFVNGSRASGEREITSGTLLRLGAVEMEFRAFADGVQEDATTRAPEGVLGWVKRIVAQVLAGRGHVGD
jgi:pSer/pThr/pTyr-binding forkhead associated (FHA) protein